MTSSRDHNTDDDTGDEITADEIAWCDEQRANVAEYLRLQKVEHGQIGEWPAWHVSPYASIWAIESRISPGRVGWWVISGDLPTDYISSADVQPPQHPRKAMSVIAEQWLKYVEAWKAGNLHEGISIRGAHSYGELARLLESRANLLDEWARNDELWEQ